MSACNWEIPPLHTQCGSPLAHRLSVISNLCSNPGFPNIALGSSIRLIARLPQASENVQKLWLGLRMQICPKIATCSITFIRFIYKYLVWGSKQGGLWETELRWLFWWDKVIGTEAEKLCRWNPISHSWVAVVRLHFNITVCLQPWFNWCLEIFHLHLTGSVTVTVHTPIRVPIHWCQEPLLIHNKSISCSEAKRL